MKVHMECIPCTLNSFLRLADTGVVPQSRREEIMRRLLEDLSEAEYDQSPPVLARRMHKLLREVLQDPDPYKKIKDKYNVLMLSMYPEFEKLVKDSEDGSDTAMRLAIAGNVIDFGARNHLDIMDTISRVRDARFAIDDSMSLSADLKKAGSLLYIGDNCGEIVLDKLFIKCLDVPVKYFAVRGSPIINDITMEDADLVGLKEEARVITTGDDSPGVVWESSSEEFREIFNNADVIISKGQGNLEGLMDIPHSHIYFLLVTKCALMARRLGTGEGEFIVKKGTADEFSTL
jgi:damage-control phosphatase, subfamily I